MAIFWKPVKSEVTQLIADLRRANPKLEQQQAEGRDLLWRPVIDRAFQQDASQARVPQKPYVYGSDPA